MDLMSYLEQWPNYALAAEKDNAEILNFCDQRGIEGESLAFQYSRRPRFSSFSEYQSDQVYTFLGRWDGDLVVIFTLQIYPSFEASQNFLVGYFSDLMVQKGMSKHIAWDKFGSSLIKDAPKIKEFERLRYFKTYMVDDNQQAKKAIVNRGAKFSIGFNKISDYQMVNILAKGLPLPSSKNYFVEPADAESLSELLHFIDHEHKKKIFPYLFKDFEWQRRQKKWPKADLERFLVVRDRHNKIVATTLPWSPSPAKGIIVRSLPSYLNFFRKVQAIFPSLHIPRLNEELKVIYLTHLEVDASLSKESARECFSVLLDYIWRMQSRKSFHTISFIDFSQRSIAPQSRYFYQQKIPMGVYQVSYNSRDVYTPLKLKVPAIEIALV